MQSDVMEDRAERDKEKVKFQTVFVWSFRSVFSANTFQVLILGAGTDQILKNINKPIEACSPERNKL